MPEIPPQTLNNTKRLLQELLNMFDEADLKAWESGMRDVSYDLADIAERLRGVLDELNRCR